MPSPELQDSIDPSIHYASEALPNALRSGPHPWAKILVVNCSDPLTPTHVNRAIEVNYGLDRYKDVFDIQHVTASFSEPLPMSVNKHTMILTTGSAIDLGKDPELPWTYTFRELFLRRAIAAGSPILAPCFGFAQLARAHTDSMNTAFPKGVRVLGRIPIDIRSPHPLFYGFKQLTGYSHHNGSVPLELIYNSNNSMQLHAVSYDKGRTVPAMVTFNQEGTIIGTEFHRELLEDQLQILYTKKVTKIIDALVGRAISDQSVFDPGIIAQAFRLLEADGVVQTASKFIEKRGGRDWLKQGNIIEWLRGLASQYRVDIIQALEDKFILLGLEGFEDIKYANGYVNNTGLVGKTPYSQDASKLFFDNFLRLSLAAMDGSTLEGAYGSSVVINSAESSLYGPILSTVDTNSATLFFPEVVSSRSELKELLTVLHTKKWRKVIDGHSLLKWKIYEDCGMDKPDGPPNDPLLVDFYRNEFDDLLEAEAKKMNVIAIKDENGNLQALSVLISVERVDLPPTEQGDGWIDAHSIQINLLHSDLAGVERVAIEKRLAILAKTEAGKRNIELVVSSVVQTDWASLQERMNAGYRVLNRLAFMGIHFFQDGHIPLVYSASDEKAFAPLAPSFFKELRETGGLLVWDEKSGGYPMFLMVKNTELELYFKKFYNWTGISCKVMQIDPNLSLSPKDKEFYVVFARHDILDHRNDAYYIDPLESNSIAP